MKQALFRHASAAASSYGEMVTRGSFLHLLRGESVRIVEVGPRDGLQNEPKFLEFNVKVRKRVSYCLALYSLSVEYIVLVLCKGVM